VNEWAPGGEWTIQGENILLAEPGGTIAFRFHARDAHLVLSPGAHGPIRFRLLLDGAPPGASHGVDVDEDGNGVLQHGRMYQLIRQVVRSASARLRSPSSSLAPRRTRLRSGSWTWRRDDLV